MSGSASGAASLKQSYRHAVFSQEQDEDLIDGTSEARSMDTLLLESLRAKEAGVPFQGKFHTRLALAPGVQRE